MDILQAIYLSIRHDVLVCILRAGRNPQQEFKESRIPGSQFFDMQKVADLSANLPHMLPSSSVFASVMDALKISNEDTVVIYDRAGIFSAPRVYWTFRAFGHSKQVLMAHIWSFVKTCFISQAAAHSQCVCLQKAKGR